MVSRPGPLGSPGLSPGPACHTYAYLVGMNLKLTKTRRNRQLTQHELAHRAATTQATVSRLEAGIYRGSHKTQLRIAGALGVSVASIFPPRYPDA